MTSAIPTAPVQTKPTSSISVPSQNTSRNTSPIPAVPAQLPKASYANATKPATPAAINPQAPIVSSTGAQAPVQHGKVDTHSSTGPMSASSPSVGNPQSGIASGNNQNDFSRQDSHGRKPSVVISASGASGQIPNGGPVGRDARPNIAFGSMMNNQGSPAIASSSPAYPPQNNSLPVRGADPRVTSPAHSPSPIPQPPASGGKPPSGISNQGNGLVFGSSGMENGDANVSLQTLTRTVVNFRAAKPYFTYVFEILSHDSNTDKASASGVAGTPDSLSATCTSSTRVIAVCTQQHERGRHG